MFTLVWTTCEYILYICKFMYIRVHVYVHVPLPHPFPTQGIIIFHSVILNLYCFRMYLMSVWSTLTAVLCWEVFISSYTSLMICHTCSKMSMTESNVNIILSLVRNNNNEKFNKHKVNAMFICVHNMCTRVCTCWSLPSNQRGVVDHRAGQWWKGVMGQQNSCKNLHVTEVHEMHTCTCRIVWKWYLARNVHAHVLRWIFNSPQLLYWRCLVQAPQRWSTLVFNMSSYCWPGSLKCGAAATKTSSAGV